MNGNRSRESRVDELLKKALTDDLPPEVAEGMRRRLYRFRESARPQRQRFRIALAPKGAWAALSILVLVSGGLLQGRGTGNPLAEGISLVKTRLAVFKELAAAEFMTCSVRIRRADGVFVDYAITWRSGSPPEIAAQGLDGSKIMESGGTPPDIAVVLASISTPSDLKERLSGAWRLIRTSRESGCDVGTYAASAEPGPAALEFGIDMCTYLPLRLKALSWEATFRYLKQGGKP